MRITRNEASVIRAIITLPTPTRRSIAQFTSTSLVLASSTLSSLEQKGMLTKQGVVQGGGGRPVYVYGLRADLGHTVGISLTPSSFRIVVMNGIKELVHDETHDLELSERPGEHLQSIVDQVHTEVTELLAAPEYDHSPAFALGLTLPGMTDADQGIWVQGLQVTGISQINIRRIFEERAKIPVFVEDPARALTFYEQRMGLGRDVPDFVLLFLGYGVGAGIVIDSEIYRGFKGLAGEIGHLVVDPQGYRCSCGDVGCLETVASTGGILRRVRERLHQGVISTLLAGYSSADKELSLRDVLEAADNDDRLAQSTLFEVGELIGRACSTAVKLVNPERIIISGPGGMFREYFQPRIDMDLQEHVVPEMLSDFSLHFSDYSAHDEAYGVALLSMEGFWETVLAEFDKQSTRELDIALRT